MTKTPDAYASCLTASLGLSARELAEIGGFTDRHARDILAGNVPCPLDVIRALEDLQDDLDVVTDALVVQVEEGSPVIMVWRDKDSLRENVPEWPGRGHAYGGFPGPHRIAALTALEALRDRGIDVDLVFAG